MIHLQSLRRKDPQFLETEFPFSVPTITQLPDLTFRSAVTFFVGENGTGKSTLLEAIAAGAGSILVGSDDIGRDPSLASARRLAAALVFSWQRKTHRGFFLRAEDFFNYGRRIVSLVQELDDIAATYEQELTGYALQLARGTVRAQRAALVQKYGEDLNARSHGESFLHLFQERFVPEGLYLLDEPDTALSPQRQLALVSMLKEMVAQDAQFIIATHSPILMAYPDATIISFDECPIRSVEYDRVPNVSLTRDFLSNPQRFLKYL